ncbi:MAG: hypothetical protein HC830_09800 [Bacteroidetes bacterium]|nr:hypothetical protein [Bacteroidota bacterium]
MDLHDFYTKRIDSYSSSFAILQKKENQLSGGRLAVFILSLILFYVFFQTSVLLSVILLIAGFFSLGWIIQYQNRIIREKEFFGHLITINNLELKSLSGDYYSFADGIEYSDKSHPYAYDLDIFGRASLFQYINRTVSQPAANMLASWLKYPAGIDEIKLRQTSVLELKDLTDWRQKLNALGYEYKNAANHPEAVLAWMDGPNRFFGRRFLRVSLVLLSLITLTIAALVITGMPSSLLVTMILINMGVYYKYFKDINKLHQQVSRSFEMLQSYGQALKLIEQQTFTSPKLISLVNSLKGNGSASELIKKLSVLVNRLDTRLNLMISLPLNVFFFWDLHYCYALESWKHRNAGSIRQGLHLWPKLRCSQVWPM